MTDAPSPDASCTDPRLLLLAPEDNICAAADTLQPGETLLFQGRPIVPQDRIPTGHKIAVRLIAAGQKVFKYGAAIGSATCDILPGEYVHLHNLRSDYLPTFGTAENRA
jgi:altronate dehydratase small subunit